MCVTSPFGCAYLCASVTKSWPSFRRTESHRLGSPLDGQGLARGWEGPLRLSTHSSRPERSPRSSPALAWWKETCQYIHDLRHCWKEGKRAKRRKQEKRQSRWKLKKKKKKLLTVHRCGWGAVYGGTETGSGNIVLWTGSTREQWITAKTGNKERDDRWSDSATSRLSSSVLKKKGKAGGLGRGGGVSTQGQLHLSTHILHSISHQSGQYGCRQNSTRPQTFPILIPKKLIWLRPFPFTAVSLCSQVAQRSVMHL